MRVAVTGAFGYSGKYMAQRLLDGGHHVLTLTNSPNRPNPFGQRVRVAAFNFDNPAALRDSLRGVDALINTYWVRFDRPPYFTHARAVANTKVLFHAARDAGVQRIVHVSITKPDIRSPLPYFSGKAELEEGLKQTGLSYCILRPTVLFGREDVLVNNIAWGLRHMPIFAVFGDGSYRLQPIYVDDLAEAAVAQCGEHSNQIIDAIGPETYSYRRLVEVIAHQIGVHPRITAISPALGYFVTRLLGLFVNDAVITREEIEGLMAERLYVDSPPLGQTRLSDWVHQHRGHLGLHYTSEMARRLDRVRAYGSS
jgi:NADH dehydrogenase